MNGHKQAEASNAVGQLHVHTLTISEPLDAPL